MQLTFLWVIASAIIKFTYKGRVQAEVKAAQATETAEAESLKRQVVEARRGKLHRNAAVRRACFEQAARGGDARGRPV